MADKKTSGWSVLLGFILVLVSAGMAVVVITIFAIGTWWLWKQVVAQSAQVATAIIAGAFSLVATITALVITKIWERRKEIELELRKKKTPVYDEFVDFLSTMFTGSPHIDKPDEAAQAAFFLGFTKNSIIWSSDKVLKEYSTFRRQMVAAAKQPESDPYTGLIAYENMLKAIRVDMGHKNKGLKEGDLLAFYVNDIDQVLQERAAARRKR